MSIRVVTVAALVSVLTALVLPAPAAAQLNGQNIKGDTGLKSGSQAPPGTYFVVPLYFYTADAVKNRDGKTLFSGNLDAAVFGAGLNVVTNRKILGANYGALVVLPGANNRLQGAADFGANPGAGLTDLYVQPINLGWHTPRLDVTTAYGLFVPIGRYEDGASNNTGLGMWGNEFLLGTTVYLNQARTLHAATTATLDIHSKKKDNETKVGNILNLEGGVGADLLGGGLTAGLAYYGSFKLSDDAFQRRLSSVLLRGKGRVWGLGPEVTMAIAAKRTVYGFVTVRYQWEVGARTTTEGAAWNILATIPLRPIKLP